MIWVFIALPILVVSGGISVLSIRRWRKNTDSQISAADGWRPDARELFDPWVQRVLPRRM